MALQPLLLVYTVLILAVSVGGLSYGKGVLCLAGYKIMVFLKPRPRAAPAPQVCNLASAPQLAISVLVCQAGLDSLYHDHGLASLPRTWSETMPLS